MNPLTDSGILVTGAAMVVAFGWGRGKWLRHMLALAWTIALLLSLAKANMASTVLAAAVMDFLLAGVALSIATNDPSRIDARAVGGISMAKMPAHWVMSVSSGSASWFLYAVACNAGFVLQCLIVRGWMDGLGRAVARIVGRLRPVHLFRDGRR
jgi:hypothetical protein